jgi:Zn-finger nucleic acid-binding protein
MVHKTPREIGDLVRAAQKNRRSAQTIASVSDQTNIPPPTDPNEATEGREWIFAHPDRGETGPLGLSDLLVGEGFSPSSRVKNLTEGLEGRAEDFPQIREAFRRQRQGRPVEMKSLDRCPRCRIPLGDTFYEGIPIKVCRRCGGKLVDRNDMNRIIARREIGFSEALVRKAEVFREKVLLNPAVKTKSDPPPSARLQCPACGFRMMPRPFNYQYFVPVDKCMSCSRIWFDPDELEILQILIELAKGD